MTRLPAIREGDPARGLRSGLLVIALLGAAGTAIELALDRHWGGFYQWLPWPAVGATLIAIALLLARPRPMVVVTVRALCLAVVALGVIGVLRHVISNYETAPLDAVYGLKWESMSAAARWWAAASGSVGPSPPLAPAALAIDAACVALATWRHPAATG